MSATVLMSSCGLYNKYERPDVNTTGLVRDVKSATDTLAVTDTTSFGNLPWRIYRQQAPVADRDRTGTQR